MDVTGSRGESRQVKFSLVGGVHDGAVRVGDADGIGGGAAIDDIGVDSAKVRSAAAIGDSKGAGGKGCGGGTY